MAATLAEIRDAIQTTLSQTGLRVYDTAPDKPEFPCAVVIPISAEFDQAFGRGVDRYEFDIDVMTSGVSDRAGQNALDAFVGGYGTQSIRALVFSSPTLGLTGTASRVEGFTEYGAFLAPEGARYFRAVLRLLVLTSGI